MGNVQQKIEEESKKAKKAKCSKKDEKLEKIVEENVNSNYNKKRGRGKKEYIYLVRTIKIKINYKAQYSQQDKLHQWFGTCFNYNQCVSWCRLASR